MTDAHADMSWVNISYTKWPDQPHYAYRMRVLGNDGFGVWGSCDIGEDVYKAGMLAFVRETALLCLIPRRGCWSALWYPPSEVEFETYVDINTEPMWTADAVAMVDLDFDVVRRRDGSVELVDEDEFEEHSVSYGYPDDLVALARSAAVDVRAQVANAAEPFGSTWRAWYRRCFPEAD